MFGALDVSTSGLIAQRIQMDLIAGNVANSQTTRRLDGRPGPFLRQVALVAAGDGKGGAGVHVSRIVEDRQQKPRAVHDPGHVDADKDGYVYYPNVDMATEMINMMVASRAYEANITAIEATKSILNSSLRIIA